ncbi:14 kDa phosphohistidine phosphatase, partial [Xenoophorus captivus]
DIYDKVSAELEGGSLLDCECIGGGRIKHDPDAKKIHVYGYSIVSRDPLHKTSKCASLNEMLCFLL